MSVVHAGLFTNPFVAKPASTLVVAEWGSDGRGHGWTYLLQEELPVWVLPVPQRRRRLPVARVHLLRHQRLHLPQCGLQRLKVTVHHLRGAREGHRRHEAGNRGTAVRA